MNAIVFLIFKLFEIYICIYINLLIPKCPKHLKQLKGSETLPPNFKYKTCRRNDDIKRGCKKGQLGSTQVPHHVERRWSMLWTSSYLNVDWPKLLIGLLSHEM